MEQTLPLFISPVLLLSGRKQLPLKSFRGKCDNLQNLACMSNQMVFVKQHFELGTNELKTYFK